MALRLLLFNFSKRQNSTAAPADNTGVAVDVTLKNETSLNSPVFLLSGARPNYTYAKFEGAYYFIDDIRSVRNNLYEIACTLDVLATHKAQIANTSAFIEFCAQGSTELTDNRIVPKGLTPSAVQGSAQIPLNPNGTYLLSAIGENSGVRQFCLGKAGMNTILDSIQNWYNSAIVAGNEWEIIGKNFISSGSAMECVRECRWVPFDVAALDSGGGTSELTLGQFHTGLNFHWLGSMIYSNVYTVNIPFSRAGWLRLQPYTDVSVFLPFVGVVSLNHPIFSTNNVLQVEFSVNLSSGDIAYELICGGVRLGSYGASTAVSIPVGSSNISPSSIFNSIAGAALSLSYGNVIGAAGAIMSAFEATQTSVGGISGGAGAGLEDYIVVAVTERGTSGVVGNMAAVQGLPYFNTARLGNLSGYIKTRDASVQGSIRGSVRERINDLLNGGFFME